MHSISLFLVIASLASLSVAKPTNHNVQEDMYGKYGNDNYEDQYTYGGADDYSGGKNPYGGADDYSGAKDMYGGADDYYGGANDYSGGKNPYGGADDYSGAKDMYGEADDYYGGADDYSGAKDMYGAMPKKPCKCECGKTPIYEMDEACHKKCVKPTAIVKKPCKTPIPTPTKPCTTSVYQPAPTHVGTSPVNEKKVSPEHESRPSCAPVTVTKTVDHVKTDYKTVTATQTIVKTSVVESIKVVPTTVVKVKTVKVERTATVTKTCTQTSTVHDVEYKTITKEVIKTVTVGAKPTQESKPPCHECEAASPIKSDYGEVKPYAGADAKMDYKPTPSSDYPTTVPTGYADHADNKY